MKSKLTNSYGFIFEDELIHEIGQVGQFVIYPKGKVIIDFDDQVKFIPLIISGAIKVMREDEEGDALLLYYLEQGDTCSITMNCCLGNSKSDVKAIVEEDSEMVMIPIEFMEKWILKYNSWKEFVFQSYHARFQEMLEAIDTLAFMNMPERISKYLSDKVKVLGSTTLNLTHQDIALDLHSSRVVVSRILKKLESEGSIRLNRNKIEVIQF